MRVALTRWEFTLRPKDDPKVLTSSERMAWIVTRLKDEEFEDAAPTFPIEVNEENEETE